MAQNRKPPAFQEYAAEMMARVDYRSLSLAERGLLYTMRLECWVNRLLPSDPVVLGKILGFDASQIAAILPNVMLFFGVENGQIFCPELDDYRAHISTIRAKQSDGGKQGAAMTNGKANRPEKPSRSVTTGKSPGYSSGESAGNSRVESRVRRQVKPSLAQPCREDELTTEVVDGKDSHDF